MTKNKLSIAPPDKKKTLEAFFRYYELSRLLFEESNRVMLALLEDSFNLIRDIEDSKSIILQTKIVIKK